MARTYICEYQDCHRLATVLVTRKNDEIARFTRFCSDEHAGLFLLKKAWGDKEPAKTYANKLKGEISKSL